MDIYGAFQLCSLGTLATPLTARVSRTYYNDTGRNVVFLWFGLMAAGLASLAIEFIRVHTNKCTSKDSGSPLSHANQWNYGDTCGLTCSEEEGPFSQIRRDAASNIYVIPAPTILTLGTATLISAACCIPPILSMVTSWKTVFKTNWQARFHRGTAIEGGLDRPVDDTSNTAPTTIKRIEAQTRQFFLVAIEVPINLALVSPRPRAHTPCVEL